MNTRFLVTAASMSLISSCKPFRIDPFHFHSCNTSSTKAYTQTLFSQFASTKLNLSEADIARVFKLQPQLQNLRTFHKVEQSILMFKKHGFADAQIAKIMRMQPWLIRSAVITLEPKLKLLEDFGIMDQKLTRFLTINPSVLCLSPKSNLLPKLEFLKNVFGSEDLLVKALLRAPILLSINLDKVLKPSVAFWEGWGFSGMGLVSFLLINPHVLSRTSLTPAQVDLIHKIGVDKERKMYKYIVSKVSGSRVETLEAKIENFKRWGLSAEEAFQVLRAVPAVLSLSKTNAGEKMNYIVNDMELPANIVVKRPSLLNLNFEKIVRPRFLVWQKIKSMNDDNPSFFKVLWMSEARFVSKIIEGHPESKMLWTIYESALPKASNRTESSAKTKFWITK